MDLAQALRELWRHKLWLVVGLFVAGVATVASVYKVSPGIPPKLETKEIQYGRAGTDVLVDAPESPIADIDSSFLPLAARAVVYSRLLSSEPVKRLIGEEMGIPPQIIQTGGPPLPSASTRGRETSAQGRQDEIAGESGVFRLYPTANDTIPLVRIVAQAPTAELATKLANASAVGLNRYVTELQREQKVAPRQRVRLRQLGAASGGLVNEGTDYQIAALALFGVFGLWCVAVLLVLHLRQSLREDDAAALAAGEAIPFRGSTADGEDQARRNGVPEEQRELVG